MTTLPRSATRPASRSWVPWVPWALAVLMLVLAVTLPYETTPTGGPPVDPTGLLIIFGLQSMTFSTVGLVVMRAQPGHAIGRLFAAVGVIVAFYLLVDRYQYNALVVHPSLPFGEVAAWVTSWIYVVALSILLAALPQLFPTGRPVSPRWRWLLVLSAAAFVLAALTDATAPGRISASGLRNPYALSPGTHTVVTTASISLYSLVTVLGFVSLVVRWRRADHRTRQQIKLFVLAAATLPLFVVVNGLVNTLASDVPALRLAGTVVALTAFLGLPIATGVSIVRHRLFDVDLVINRTLVYGALTAVLLATYSVSVLLLRLAVEPLTGRSDLAVAVSTLSVVGLFGPLRGRIQRLVDRRFYRSRYDAARTLEHFSGRLRHEVDLDSLDHDLRAVVQRTMQPTHVSIWLRDRNDPRTPSH